jgi:lactate dehydrogenase-like 2-hydroxyacid dehydrogenase
MKAIAYSIKSQEKESLILTNAKKHDLTLISNELNLRTVLFAYGKEVVIVSPYDIVDRALLREMKNMGITQLITRSKITLHIDLNSANELGFKVAHVSDGEVLVPKISEVVISHLDHWEKHTCKTASNCSIDLLPTLSFVKNNA